MKRFSTGYVVVVFAILLGLISCKDINGSDGACDAGNEFVNYNLVLDNSTLFEKAKYPLPKGNIVFYENFGTTVKFYIFQPQLNICPKEHFKVDFSVGLAKDPALVKDPLLSIKIYGELLWNALVPTQKVTLKDQSEGGSSIDYTGTTEIGLTQTFGENAGDVDSFLTVEFADQGSLTDNIAYLKENVLRMRISYKYSKHSK